ncbi:hypothetical protein [Streptosporangium roseum]|uniref:hypothetical protein n=1 Tax=Streptosporangium roseum TaxID=2001 RepID=UPI00331BDB45
MTARRGMTDLYSRREVTRRLPPFFTFEAAPAVDGRRAFHERDRRFGSWAVEVRGTGVAAGTVLFRPIPGGELRRFSRVTDGRCQ